MSGDREAAIRRVEESRRSHAEWAEHIPTCGHCQEHGPPQYIQSLEEHKQIVAEYDNVLACLRASTAQDEGAAAEYERRLIQMGSKQIAVPARAMLNICLDMFREVFRG